VFLSVDSFGQGSIRFVRIYGPGPSGLGGMNMIILDEVQYVPSDSGFVTTGLATYMTTGSGFPPIPQFVPGQLFVVKTDKWGRPEWMVGLDKVVQTTHIAFIPPQMGILL